MATTHTKKEQSIKHRQTLAQTGSTLIRTGGEKQSLWVVEISNEGTINARVKGDTGDNHSR